MQDLKFLVQIDSVAYKEKPQGNEIAKIKARTQGSVPREFTIKDFSEMVQKGFSFSPGILENGLKAENWTEQQIFCIDIDNENKNEPIMEVKQAIEICKDKGLPITMLYYSYSFTKEKPKFRLVFVLCKPIKNKYHRKIFINNLISLFPQADKSCVNPDRIFFGTNNLCKVSSNYINLEKIIEFCQPTVENLSAELEQLKDNFDFQTYLEEDYHCEKLRENDETIMYKQCPICGHNNCFVYYKKTKTFYCFGQHGNIGGTIIDFLINTKNLSKNQAIEYFKYEICKLPKFQNSSNEFTQKLNTISAQELIDKSIPEPYFCVKNLISQGIVILAAPPKYRKSWFVLLLCIKVAMGEEFLGFETNKSDTLYLALEDSNNRVKKRIKKILDDKSAPENFYIAVTSDTLGNGLIQSLEDYLAKNKNIKLIVIDTLQKVRGVKNNPNAYANDYYDLGLLKKFADKHSMCILVTHHLKKDSKHNEFVFDKISGTNGLFGSADTALVIDKYDKDTNQSTLHITGRDIESDELLIQFNKDNCQWLCLGNAEIQAEKRRQKEYEEKPLVIAITKFLKEQNEWSGSATELKQILTKYNFYDFDASNLAKNLKSLTKDFFTYSNIKYVAPNKNGSNGHRTHKLKLCKTFGDIYDVDSIFTDLPDLPDTLFLPDESTTDTI